MREKECRFIEKLYAEHYTKLYYYALSIIKNHHTAENFVNETFVTAVQKVELLIEHDNPVGWLIQVLKFKLMQHMRAEGKHPTSVPLDLVTEQSSLHSRPEDITERMFLEKVLKEKDLKMFDLFYNEGYSHQELADEFGISISASQKRLERIRKKLQEALDK